jgi:adenine-specific DNA-methyltransferase
MVKQQATMTIDSEVALARLAIDLGAEHVGGPLSATEEHLVAQAKTLPVSDGLAVAEARKRIEAGGDPLGQVFCTLRTPLERRPQGQFFTPMAIVEPMLTWALAAGPTRFVDPGCGSGRFAAAAVRRDPKLAIVAVDLDPLATLLTRATLAVLEARNALVICGDYLTTAVPPHDGVTAWVGNPPYVRHHALKPETKTWAVQAAQKVGYRISGLAGLHALFFVATVIHGKAGDVGCFVTSAEWLDVGYGSIVRNLFTNGMGGRALDLVDPRAVPFEDAMTTALITCFELGRAAGDVAIHLVDRTEELTRLEGGRLVPAAEMARQPRWSDLFRATRRQAHGGRTLGDIARVHRGFVTGGNEFFVMTRAEAASRGLTNWVKPAITAASEILDSDGVIHDSPELRVVLDLPADFDRTAHPDVDAYLRRGESAGVDQRYITTHRKPWWHIGIGRPAPIVASYMARQAPKFALNPDGLALLNIGHGIHPREPMTGEQLSALTEALNAGRAGFAGTGRTYHGGLEKFEPREMEALPIPELP